ncbi:DUF418 domain-containing protein [Algoriphagus machipongonensis]|uniref:Membrane protein n=1 Tax=Algoriphagus machipongonensis TaxID=388413 RepID=A3HTP0_9BACT|nr:DUF418 domain-containing protein [Algoriphagus machipongonensis]EAZ83208.1 membrane protein [Algoriphagus machipongonensis]
MPQPISQSNRIELLDIFRGFAVFGIFVVNIEIMNCAFPNQEVFSQQWESGWSTFIFRVMQLFFYSKFFPVFSFLFGLGISMQAIKMKESGTASITFFIRRMFFLFLLGLVHIIFLWNGDVIHLYAILGLFILIILPLSKRMLLVLVALVLLFPFYDQIASFLFEKIQFSPEYFLANYSSNEITEILRNGPYLKSIEFRIDEYFANIPLLFFYLAPIAFAMFLLGVFFGKNQYHKDLKSLVKLIKKPVIITMVISNLYRVIFIFLLPDWGIYRNEFLRPVFFKLMYLSDLAFGLFYLWLIAYIWHYTPWKKWLEPLKYPGRMALTNYIFQSVFGLIIFSSLGFGLYEKLSPMASFIIAIIVFLIQVIYSKIWLSYFIYGPLEWAWRCFTYLKIFPIRLTKQQLSKDQKHESK